MDRTTPDPKQKRERFRELAQTGKVKTDKVFAADLRQSKVLSSANSQPGAKLIDWSQRKAVSVLGQYYFHVTSGHPVVGKLGRRETVPQPSHCPNPRKISHRSSNLGVPKKKMSQLTSIQILDTAIRTELGTQEDAEAEAFYNALGTLLSRWLIARSDYPEMEAIKLFAKVRAYVAKPERFL
jgi:hypothetical protein